MSEREQLGQDFEELVTSIKKYDPNTYTRMNAEIIDIYRDCIWKHSRSKSNDECFNIISQFSDKVCDTNPLCYALRRNDYTSARMVINMR